MPPIHSDLHVRHMDQLKTIMARFVIIFQYLQLGILEFSGCVLDGRKLWQGEGAEEFEKLREAEQR